MKVVSSCPLRVASIVWQAASGTPIVTIAAKATFVLLPTESPLSDEQEDPNPADGYWNDDERRSLHVAGDLPPLKARADVILVGHAFAPRGVPVRSLVARMVVGDVDKSVEVVSDRAFSLDGALHEGPRFTTMPLTWERAAGGPHTTNPVGVRADAPPDTRGWTPLPNLQPPGTHVATRGDFIAPAGFGPISPWWPGRQGKLHRGLAGWDFREWFHYPLPADLDGAFFNVAPPDQQTDGIRPDERIVLENLLRDHARLVTSLAPVTPRVRIERTSGPSQELEMRCDTLSIDTDRGTVALTWRRQLLLEQPDSVSRAVVLATGAKAASAVPADVTGKRRASLPAIDADAGAGAESVTGTLLPNAILTAEMPFVRSGAPLISPPSPADTDVTGTVIPGKLLTRELPFVKGGAPPQHVPPAARPLSSRTIDTSPDPIRLDRTSRPALPFRSTSKVASPSSAWTDDEQTQPVAVHGAAATPWQEGQAADPAPPPVVPPSVAPPPIVPPPAVVMSPVPPAIVPPPIVPPSIVSQPPDAVRPGSAPMLRLLKPLDPPRPPPAVETPEVREPPAPPPLIGPLAAPPPEPPPEGETSPAPEPPPEADVAPAPEPANLAGDDGETADSLPTAPVAPRPREVTIELCGAITAAIAMARDETDKILEAERLDKDAWKAASQRWDEALREEQGRGKTTLRKKFDEAYVQRVEERRGPITPDEYARLVVASERGSIDGVVKDLGIPRGAPMRIERVWLAKLMQDPILDARARAAITAEREK
jgi:hypothetical protein